MSESVDEGVVEVELVEGPEPHEHVPRGCTWCGKAAHRVADCPRRARLRSTWLLD